LLSGLLVAALTITTVVLTVANLRHVSTGRIETDGLSVRPESTPETRSNPIRTENARAGTKAWQMPLAPGGAIEGYASATSVAPGAKLGLHVSTQPAAKYRVDVYRLGWYGGTGARLVECLPSCSGDRQGAAQGVPQPAPSGELRAGWPTTDEVTAQADWVSGYYIAKLVLVDGAHTGKAATIPFIVVAPSSRRSAVLVQAAANTWQAYNNWGGKSLYDFNSSNGVPAVRVSFDRPIVEDKVLNYPFTWEYPLVRFLEKEGVDVAYVSNVDAHRDPSQYLKHKLVMTAGHDEYWTKETRDGFDAALAAGVNLMFMGSNTGYWQIRYDDSERTIIAYRNLTADPITDPVRKTVRFRDLPTPRPECQLMGVQSRGGLAGPADPRRAYMPTPAAASDPWFANTGLSSTSVLDDLVGYEWDVINAGCQTPPLTVLFHYEGAPSNADAVRFTAPSGARVFASGSLQFSWGLDDWGRPRHADPGLQQFMRNALQDMIGAPTS
jgi:hypothetical protein